MFLALRDFQPYISFLKVPVISRAGYYGVLSYFVISLESPKAMTIEEFLVFMEQSP